jgi:hypothetical protein
MGNDTDRREQKYSGLKMKINHAYQNNCGTHKLNKRSVTETKGKALGKVGLPQKVYLYKAILTEPRNSYFVCKERKVFIGFLQQTMKCRNNLMAIQNTCFQRKDTAIKTEHDTVPYSEPIIKS